MAEENLEITKTTRAGKTYNNINLKTRVKGGSVIQGIQPGNHIVVKKVKWEQGRKLPNYPLYSCTVEYKGEECSFVLKEDEHQQFTKFGLEDKIKISLTQEKYTYEGVEGVKAVLNFEKVE